MMVFDSLEPYDNEIRTTITEIRYDFCRGELEIGYADGTVESVFPTKGFCVTQNGIDDHINSVKHLYAGM